MSECDAFAPISNAWSADMTEDVRVTSSSPRQMARPWSSRSARAIPIAERTGGRVIGIDSSPARLAVARERAAAAGVEIDLRERDMRDPDLAGAATDLVIGPGRSLLHLPTRADRRPVFERLDEASRELVWVARKPG